MESAWCIREFMLIDGYDVAENIKLNRENVKKTPASLVFGKRLDLVDRASMHKESRATWIPWGSNSVTRPGWEAFLWDISSLWK